MALVTQTETATRYIRPLESAGQPGEPWGQCIYTGSFEVNAIGAADTGLLILQFDLPVNQVWSLQKFNLVMSGGSNAWAYSSLSALYSPDPNTDLVNQTSVTWPLVTQDIAQPGSTIRFFNLGSAGGDVLGGGALAPANSPDLFTFGSGTAGADWSFTTWNQSSSVGPWTMYYTMLFNGYTLEQYLNAETHFAHYPAR